MNIDRLTKKEKVVLYFMVTTDLTYGQIAEQLGISKELAASRGNRVRSKFGGIRRKALKEMYHKHQQSNE